MPTTAANDTKSSVCLTRIYIYIYKPTHTHTHISHIYMYICIYIICIYAPLFVSFSLKSARAEP